jgi:hypothetical protein
VAAVLADVAESAASGLRANDPEPAQRVSAAAPRTSPRYSWAELMMRVFDIDVLRCELCGSRREAHRDDYGAIRRAAHPASPGARA